MRDLSSLSHQLFDIMPPKKKAGGKKKGKKELERERLLEEERLRAEAGEEKQKANTEFGSA